MEAIRGFFHLLEKTGDDAPFAAPENAAGIGTEHTLVFDVEW